MDSYSFSTLMFMVGSFAVFSVLDYIMRNFKSKRQQSACSSLKDETIYVALLNYSGSGAGGRCLYSLFENAKCPTRIHVGIYEASYIPRGGAVEFYDKLQKRFSSSALNFKTQIKSFPVSSRNGGSYVARQHLIEKTYADEKYILTLNDNVEMLKNWDEELVRTLSSLPKNNVVVAPPSPAKNVFTWLFDSNLDARYPVVGGFSESGLPLHTSKPFLGNSSLDSNVQKSLLWMSSCSFCHASFFVESKKPLLSLNHENQNKNEDEEQQNFAIAIARRNLPNLFLDDTLLTCDAMAAGWNFHCSTRGISRFWFDSDANIVSTRSGIPLEDIFKDSKETRDIMHKELGPYLQEIGLYKKATSKAFLGVVDPSNREEIGKKHGFTVVT